MAKKPRLITASEKVSNLVNRGYEVDVDLKNLTFEDKGIKKMLADELEAQFGEDTALRVEGTNGAAVISQSETYVLNGNAETVATVREAAEKGLLGDAVKVNKVLNVPADDRERAAEILQAAGIGASTSVELTVVPADYRQLMESETASEETAAARESLKELAERKLSYRVKYEKI